MKKMNNTGKPRAPRNKTLVCCEEEVGVFSQQLITGDSALCADSIEGKIIHADTFATLPSLPPAFVDLLIVDPPYNLSKNYHGHLFKEKEKEDYMEWFESLIAKTKRLLKPHATIYICSDWKTSVLIAPILEKHFYVHNRITWERDKGRGAKSNWKNNTEDIWFCSNGKDYHFNVDAVKLKRKVIAPYRLNGKPKDWEEEEGGNFRLTFPSNIWSDISIPFWSMPENTDHPTQKPEKLIAKLILASSKEGDFVFDPFLGSGTTAVVAKKLNRKFSGIEQNLEYCCWGQKRLALAEAVPEIQGYADGVFWERNSLSDQAREGRKQQ
ncbi:MAG: DNA-methyltransferase [Akkermansiaceae bacterium]